MKNLKDHIVSFVFEDKNKNYDERADHQAILMAFEKNNTKLRKDWIQKYDPNRGIDYEKPQITINEYINDGLIQYSVTNTIRSIPCFIDGLKDS